MDISSRRKANSHLSKEEMALEALIKIVTILESERANYYFHQDSLDYAHKALNANGWEVTVNEFGLANYRRIDSQNSIAGEVYNKAYLE